MDCLKHRAVLWICSPCNMSSAPRTPVRLVCATGSTAPCVAVGVVGSQSCRGYTSVVLDASFSGSSLLGYVYSGEADTLTRIVILLCVFSVF
jgi:hypothetical protein